MPDSPPQVNAFILCDQAFQQALTGKWCIIGTFGIIWAREFPGTHAPICVFIGLSDFHGDAQVEVHIRDPEGNDVCVVRAQIPRIPISIAEFAFPFPPVEFKRPGSYTLELVVAGELLVARSFRVEKAPATPPGMPPGQLPPWIRPPQPPGLPADPEAPGSAE